MIVPEHEDDCSNESHVSMHSTKSRNHQHLCTKITKFDRGLTTIVESDSYAYSTCCWLYVHEEWVGFQSEQNKVALFRLINARHTVNGQWLCGFLWNSPKPSPIQ
ncbi:hypothetical protein CRM22_002182 [Opisthorchis felineus]|uniref:Uncharacterized protein n=1 Tax=Opisthorchis felineus TaxID=147828 RepID=A0A4S2MDN0_OPIFE|nr:hypothetical protein CRM22_002182 [Opisthorchis felineus]